MKPRLFRTILLAFSLVIVLGIVGMLVVGGLMFRSFWQPDELGINTRANAIRAILADYYIAHDSSWEGVGQRLEELALINPYEETSLTLLDNQGLVLATNDEEIVAMGINASGKREEVPIQVHQTKIGTLLLSNRHDLPRFGKNDFGPSIRHGSSARFWPAVRGFLLAGLGVAGALLGLATIFARRLAHPIHQLTVAAQALAAGNLDVRVRDASVRELHDLASAFNSMSSALSRADQQRRQMTADIAHELRTPLTIIKGRLEGLQDGVYDASPEQIQLLLDESQLLERLIEDLRLLALADAGQLPLYREPTEVGELLDTAAATFAAQAAAHGVTLQAHSVPNLAHVDLDPQRIAQVLANLITNAIRHTPSGGSITLQASNASAAILRSIEPPETPLPPHLHGGVLVQIRDTGHGIASADVPRIFDRFWRAEGARSRASGGGGLGLAIARQIILAHNGVIWAESSIGTGTMFSILLPALRD